ncbi:GIY-YIG nuclease family protein [Paenibacillus sabinae]|uniref:Excinuclease ABC subunit C domain-containing protein n=1 Tax=Paenibacillus sabinae T27 TaxID=1268072 RepID=X4ZKY0_9BACL|nr:GIY-YIG nuclease family protein [Paenibacillus sabinae]AHV97947.1 Excinuclease ABC subunit C domain-containing protein [Paenibacillus sabinae T27]
MKEKIQSLPSSPGVYLMKDSLGGIIYVGKSKNLKKRVQSYFYQSKSQPKKIKALVSHIRDLEHRVTDTEFEAFMLECRLIQELKPMYNKKMKNPLAYTYIVIKVRDGLRRIEIAGEPAGNDGAVYFGPYTASRHSVERVIQSFLVCCQIACSSAGFNGSACLNHSLGLCRGVCLGGEAVDEYNEIIDRFIAMLDGSDRSLYEEMRDRMQRAAERYDFETAAKFRDCIEAFDYILMKEKVIGFTGEDRNIVVIEELDEDRIKLFLIKRSRILYSERISVRGCDTASLCVKIKTAIYSYFGPDTRLPSSEVSREEVDEAQIIYSYLQRSDGRYLVIPEEWLGSESSAELDDALDTLLDNAGTPVIH